MRKDNSSAMEEEVNTPTTILLMLIFGYFVLAIFALSKACSDASPMWARILTSFNVLTFIASFFVLLTPDSGKFNYYYLKNLSWSKTPRDSWRWAGITLSLSIYAILVLSLAGAFQKEITALLTWSAEKGFGSFDVTNWILLSTVVLFALTMWCIKFPLSIKVRTFCNTWVCLIVCTIMGTLWVDASIGFQLGTMQDKQAYLDVRENLGWIGLDLNKGYAKDSFKTRFNQVATSPKWSAYQFKLLDEKSRLISITVSSLNQESCKALTEAPLGSWGFKAITSKNTCIRLTGNQVTLQSIPSFFQ